MEQKKKLYTIAVSYKTRVEATTDDGAIREASYPLPSEKGLTHLEMRVLGAREIETASVVTETPAPQIPDAPGMPDIPY